MARPDKIKSTVRLKREAFLSTLEKTGSYGAAARAAGYSVGTLKQLEEKDEDWEAEVLHAQRKFVANLEAVALARATGQMKKAILFKGKQVRIKNPKNGKMEDYFESEWADNVLMFLMKANDPKYRTDKQQIEANLTYKEIKGVSTDDL